MDGSSVGAVTTYPFSNVTAQPYNLSDICPEYLHHHAHRRGQRDDFPSSAVTVNSGASQTFTITPATGYQVAKRHG